MNFASIEESDVGVFERYAEKARQTVVRAKHEADRFGSPEVNPEHILLALLSDSALTSNAIEGVSEPEIRAAINAQITPQEPNPLPHDLPLSKEARIALVLAMEEADKLGQRYVQNEHILLALLQCANTYAAQLLKQRGLCEKKLRLQIRTLPQPKEARKPGPVSKESRAAIELIRAVGDLKNQGQGQKALRLLDDFLAEPEQDRKLRMTSMGPFAAITALQIGDIQAARRYCEDCLVYTPDDPLVLYKLADCLARLGQPDEARKLAVEGREAAVSRNDEIGRSAVTLIEQRFPELKGGP